jgi:hypothetical protein
MREKLPGNLQRFKAAYPDVYEAFEELGRQLHETGPLSERERSGGEGAKGGRRSRPRPA